MNLVGGAEPSHALPFELESLANAVNYQRWVSDAVQPFLGRRIVEVGAGIGNMSQWLPVRDRLILTETEPALLEVLRARAPRYFGDGLSKVSISPLDLTHHLPSTALSALQHEHLDTIVSFNVLEHIEDDRAAVRLMLDVLRASSQSVRRLVNFVPAQAWALSPLDTFYGHFRRYSGSRIRALSRELAPDAALSLTPFNAVGLLGWVWSALVLRRTIIDPASVKRFDAICPYTKHVDNFACRMLRYPFGQSFVWVLTLPVGNAS